MIQPSHSWAYTETRIERDMCTPMFIVALFIIARITLPQPLRPLCYSVAASSVLHLRAFHWLSPPHGTPFPRYPQWLFLSSPLIPFFKVFFFMRISFIIFKINLFVLIVS